jgi:hypothetical protein
MISVEETALHSKKTGGCALERNISWMAVSEEQQEKTSNAERKKKTLTLILTLLPIYGIRFHGALFFYMIYLEFDDNRNIQAKSGKTALLLSDKIRSV